MAKRFLRPIRVEGNIAFVPLTKGYEALIDAQDASIIGKWNWCAKETGGVVYAHRFIVINGKRTSITMHRVICDNAGDMQVDHIDMNGLNNRRANLRPATNSQNQQNKRATRHNSSGYKGVSLCKNKKKWVARIRKDYKLVFLGQFDTPEDAHAAYSKASATLHGSFGRCT